MKTLVLFGALVLMLAITPPPHFTATWQRPAVARLSWSQPAAIHETCVIRIPAAGASVLIGCWYDLQAGATGLTLGGVGPMDGNYRPTALDVYELSFDDGVAERAALRGVVYLPVFSR